MSPLRRTRRNGDGDGAGIGETIVTKCGQANYESVIADRQLV